MQRLAGLLDTLPLPAPDADPATVRCDETLLHDLGAGLPAGHLHVWGGPPGAGKTSFLLSMLYGAARSGRRVAYASYHLPASTLALRLMAMASGVSPDALLAGTLDDAQRRRASRVRACLERLPFSILEARGMTVDSLSDRLVRMPFRAEVLAIDYLQAIIRPAGTDLGWALRRLTDLAERLHVGIVVATRGEAVGETLPGVGHREGWIAPAGGSGERRASVLHNRYGERPELPLHLDEATGALLRSGLLPGGDAASS